MRHKEIVVFSDLDGTLLDHHNYSFSAATPALGLLQRYGIALILNSSKTKPEIEALRVLLDNHHPFIVENGAAVIIPSDYFDNQKEECIYFSQPVETIRTVLAQLRVEGFEFFGFNDMSIDDVMERTGLDAVAAQNAKDRVATEPLVWNGGEKELLAFTQKLSENNVQLVKGGRFYHAMGYFDKADAMSYLMDRYAERSPFDEMVSIALGDSPNDKNMLQTADYAVVIKGVNSEGLQPQKKHECLMRSQAAGPEGWNQCVMTLVSRLLGQSDEHKNKA